MPFHPVKAGDEFAPSAIEHNAMLAAAMAHRGNERFVRANADDSDGSVVWVMNTTDNAHDALTVLALDDPSETEWQDRFRDRLTFDGVLPDPENKPAHRSRVAILADKIAAGDIGPAWIAGQLTMPVDVIDTAHTRARVLDNGKLQSGYFGPVRILAAKETGLAKPCRILIDHYDGGHCLASGEIAAGTWAVPSVSNCTLAYFSAASGAATKVATPHQNTIKVYHYSTKITGAAYVQCRVICGRIVPDVAYC